MSSTLLGILGMARGKDLNSSLGARILGVLSQHKTLGL